MLFCSEKDLMKAVNISINRSERGIKKQNEDINNY